MTLTYLLEQTELVVQIVVNNLNYKEILILGSTSKKNYEIVKNDLLWKLTYESYLFHSTTSITSRFNDSSSVLYRKIHRPWCEECIGWKVSIYQEALHEWWEGRIMDYASRESSRDGWNHEFLVSYSAPISTNVWEVEVRRLGEPYLSGISRFDFIEPPENYNFQLESKKQGNISSVSNNILSSFKKSMPTWKSEFRNLIYNLPRKCSKVIKGHTDEVLDIQFSHRGDFLASASRDGTVHIFEIDNIKEGPIMTFIHAHDTYGNMVASKLNWSPNDTFLAITLQADIPNTAYGFIEILSKEHNFDAIVRTDSCPYDFHTPWTSFEDLLISHSSHISISHQHRILQNIVLLDVIEQSISSAFMLLCGQQNHARCGQIIRLPLPSSNSTQETAPFQDTLVFVSGNHTHDCDQIFFLSLDQIFRVNENGTVVTDIFTLTNIQINGLVIGLSCNRLSGIHTQLIVNVRTYIRSNPSSSTTAPLDVQDSINSEPLLPEPELNQEIELRVYNLADLTCTHIFKGHHAFTLKPYTFFIYNDSQTMQFPREDPSKTDLPRLINGFNSVEIAGNHSSNVEETVVDETDRSERQRQSDEMAEFFQNAYRRNGEEEEEEEEDDYEERFSEQNQVHRRTNEHDGSGILFASGSEDHMVYIWRLGHDNVVEVLSGHTDVVSSVSFNPAIPSMLASAADDHEIRIWTTDTLRLA